MPNTNDWPYLMLYLSLIIGGRYKTVLTKYASFQDVLDDLQLATGSQVVILSALKLNDDDFERLMADDIPALIVIR